MKIVKYISAAAFLLLLSSVTMNAAKSNVTDTYECSSDSCQKTVKMDVDENNVHETFKIYYCDGTNQVFPIYSIGDISKWPPIGILRLSEMDFHSRDHFLEFHLDDSTGNIVSWFAKPEGIDTVYFYDKPRYRANGRIGLESSDIETDFNINQYQKNDYLMFNVNTARESKISLKIVNSQGVTIATLLNGADIKGNFETNYFTGYLASGMYFAVYWIDGVPVIKKFVIAR